MPCLTRTWLALPILLAILLGGSSADLLGDVTQMAPGKTQRASSGVFDPESNDDAHHVYPGQRLLLADLTGPGEIRHMWFTLASSDRRYPRNVVLRAYWDGSDTPAIEAPIGDFFGAGNGMRANIETIPVSVSSYGRALNCYWRMPFRERAVLEVENQGSARVTVYFQAEWLELDETPKDALYFHARYKQDYPAKPFEPYVVFEGEGEGQYVGTVYSSQNTVGSWFGEADDRFYIDGEVTPSLVGTGTEDYFNDAWNLRLHSGGRKGVTICETKGSERRITAYRWHLDDPVTFRQSLRMEMERRSFVYVDDPDTGKRVQYDFKYRPDYVSSVAFWYQRGTGPKLWDMPPAEERMLPEIWIEPVRLVDTARVSNGLQPRNATNRTCNGKRFFYLRNDAAGGWVELPFVVPEQGRYAISVLQSLFHEYGVWRVTLLGPEGESELHPALDFWDHLTPRIENWPENYHHGTVVETKLGERDLPAGEYSIRFDCIGTNPLSRHPETEAFGQGFSLGLDAICLRRMPLYPHEWLAEYLPAESKLFAEWDEQTRGVVRTLADAVEAFRAEEGRYPEELSELLDQPQSGDQSFVPWPEIPLDPWGQPYRYRVPGLMNPWAFDVWSVHGNSRDSITWIGNWDVPFSVGDRAPEGAIVVEAEELEVIGRSSDAGVSTQRLTADDYGVLSGEGIRFVSTDEVGGWAEFALPAGIPAGRYSVWARAASSWDYGVAQWSIDEIALGRPLDAYSDRIGVKLIGPAEIDLANDGHVLRLDTVGKSERSGGYKVGLDALVLVPAD